MTERDELTAEEDYSLEAPNAEFRDLTAQCVRRLHEVAERITTAAQRVDSGMPEIKTAALNFSTLLAMITRLQREIAEYRENEWVRGKVSRETLKGWVDHLDVIYREWRKTERRLSALLGVDESHWTDRDIERTTDACYHALLLLKGIKTSRREESA